MPRRSQYEVEVLSTPSGNARVASAQRMTMRKKSDKAPKADTGWQKKAWF